MTNLLYLNGLGERIKTLRKEHNLTQEQLANRLGLTKSVISAYENDIRAPSHDIIFKLAGNFSVTSDYLLGLEKGRNIDISRLSEENVALVASLVKALEEKQKEDTD